jgi:hypothetical protein
MSNTVATRYNTKGKCKKCNVATSVVAERLPNFNATIASELGFSLAANCMGVKVPCRGGCGNWRMAFPVLGRLVPAKGCDGRCMAATGHNCECACGGKNHGASHAA